MRASCQPIPAARTTGQQPGAVPGLVLGQAAFDVARPLLE
jgi:hypothetical protein